MSGTTKIEASTTKNPSSAGSTDVLLERSASLATIEKERSKEPKYRDMIKDLLKKHKGLRGIAESCPDPSIYRAETDIINGAVASERNAWLCGLCVGVVAFASIRYMPRYLIKKVGGEKKLQELREADEMARKGMFGTSKTIFTLLVEGTFGFWAGWRGYQLTSSQTEGTYEAVAKIPLCEGRSAVSDGICAEWIDLTYNKIPPAFWRNLDDEDKMLRDDRTWKAVRAFADNCVKRRSYEQRLRNESGITNNNEPVSIPSPGVPDDIFDNDARGMNSISKEEAEKIVLDSKS
mmetsp:Transcript_22168/g.32627  ORF Transcript_22168/g.32627 Transcript_22168/m.32627 type:complete len:292 (+) Transcript_22168:177-1052(+)